MRVRLWCPGRCRCGLTGGLTGSHQRRTLISRFSEHWLKLLYKLVMLKCCNDFVTDVLSLITKPFRGVM